MPKNLLDQIFHLGPCFGEWGAPKWLEFHKIYFFSYILTFNVEIHFSSTVLRVVHLHVTTTFEAQDLCALYLHIPQLYPVDVTPVNQV